MHAGTPLSELFGLNAVVIRRDILARPRENRFLKSKNQRSDTGACFNAK